MGAGPSTHTVNEAESKIALSLIEKNNIRHSRKINVMTLAQVKDGFHQVIEQLDKMGQLNQTNFNYIIGAIGKKLDLENLFIALRDDKAYGYGKSLPKIFRGFCQHSQYACSLRATINTLNDYFPQYFHLLVGAILAKPNHTKVIENTLILANGKDNLSLKQIKELIDKCSSLSEKEIKKMELDVSNILQATRLLNHTYPRLQTDLLNKWKKAIFADPVFAKNLRDILEQLAESRDLKNEFHVTKGLYSNLVFDQREPLPDKLTRDLLALPLPKAKMVCQQIIDTTGPLTLHYISGGVGRSGYSSGVSSTVMISAFEKAMSTNPTQENNKQAIINPNNTSSKREYHTLRQNRLAQRDADKVQPAATIIRDFPTRVSSLSFLTLNSLPRDNLNSTAKNAALIIRKFGKL